MSRYLVMPSPAQLGTQHVTSGLVGYWDAGNSASYAGSGTTWTDLAGSANGTLVNSPAFSTDKGGSLLTNGANSYIDFGDVCDLTNSGSIVCWCLFNTFPSGTSYGTLFAKRNPANNANFGINYQTSGNLFQSYYTDGTTFRVNQTNLTTNFSTGVWYCIALTLAQSGTSTVQTIYRNGSSVATSTTAGNIAPNSAPLRLGNYMTFEYASVRYAILKVYDRALSASEITQNFNAFRGRFGL